ncbi:MAG: hypothetical protein EOP51_27500 [Sphingobacteriales bacterium]|nr:MAG: hypothetical protein EOP51_27500 [Sphingobacteriales bacterium]
MLNKVLPAKKMLSSLRNAITPFEEKPASNKATVYPDKASLPAVDLFSLFTAGIIKEKVVFTR